MDSMNLKDFNPDNQEIETDSSLASSTYHEDINTLRIDKLSNRITIISIIIPCLIGTILLFAYFDMKKRLVDVDLTKKDHFEKISIQTEERLNALDVKIAKNSFDLNNKIPELEKKNISLEGQITKLSSTKADNKSIKTRFSKIGKQITNNTSKDIKAIKTIEASNKLTLAAIKENQTAIKGNLVQFNEKIKLIKEDTKSFKKKFDARLFELSNYEQQIAELKKTISLLDKNYEQLEKNYIPQTSLDKQLKRLSQKLTTNISKIQKDLDSISQSRSNTDKPKSQIKLPIEQQIEQQMEQQIKSQTKPSNSTEIQQEPLTQ